MFDNLDELVESLDSLFPKWEYYKTHYEPNYLITNGVSMNIIRDKIMDSKLKISRICRESKLELPAAYFKPTPERTSPDYMAPKTPEPNEAEIGVWQQQQFDF